MSTNINHEFFVIHNVLLEHKDETGNTRFDIDAYGEWCQIHGEHVLYEHHLTKTEDKSNAWVTQRRVRTRSEPIRRTRLCDNYNALVHTMSHVAKEYLLQNPTVEHFDLSPVTCLAANLFMEGK